ncbi:MAG TPA: TadE/TadG family type IV pilus assembly protein [Sphingomicrobium sp.]|nr:TadE/TadG family type IV pilus assembly protein [Sphingomicrobium sp.]
MILRRLLFDQSASSAAEFAMVLPMLMILMFGIIDAGRWMWTYNEAEKATQMGARMAVVADGVAGDPGSGKGIYSSYLGVSNLIQGDVIPASAFGKITCTGSGSGASITATCTCTTSPCPTLGTANKTAFANIVTRMQFFLPQLTASNVTIEYSSSGLGYAGSPILPDLSPLVTAKITGLTFTPLTLFALKSMPMPNFTTTLSAEDLSGQYSN